MLVGDAVTEEGSAVDRYEDGLIAGPGPPNPVEEKMREADLEAEVEEVGGSRSKEMFRGCCHLYSKPIRYLLILQPS